MKWLMLFSSRDEKDNGPEVDLQGKSDNEYIVWTGPSVRVRDGEELLNSPEMERDLAAARRLSQANKAVTG